MSSGDHAQSDPIPEPWRASSRSAARPAAGKRQRLRGGEQSARAFPRFTWLAVLFVLLAAFFLREPAALAESAGAEPGHSSGNPLVQFIIVCVLIIINSLFVLAETAMLTVRRTRIEQLVEEGNRSAVRVDRLLSEPTRMLATIQVGLTLVQLFSAGAAAESAVDPFSRFLRAHLAGTPLAGSSYTLAFVTIILSVGLLTLVVGEITPKSIAIRHAERISMVTALPIGWLQVVASPLVTFVTFLARILARPFGGSVAFHGSAMSEEELKIMVEQSEEHGVIETEEKEMIHKVFDFADTVVRKVMTPRLDITALDVEASVDDLIHLVSDSGHSRVPVYAGEIDNIIGIVHVKDVIKIYRPGPAPRVERTIRDMMRPVYFIPENKRVDDLLTEMRRSKMQIAMVRDEYGMIAGLITIEDLLEEIVGDIQDEYDKEEEPAIKQIDAQTCIVDGKLSIEEFNDRMGVEIPVEESDTIGGFVFGLLGHQPKNGEQASYDGLGFEVEATDGRRILKLRVLRHPEPAQDDGLGTDDELPADPGATATDRLGM